jgi:hypothetical protein
MEGVETRPDQQVEDEQSPNLIEVTNEVIGRQPLQTVQRKPAPQVPE